MHRWLAWLALGPLAVLPFDSEAAPASHVAASPGGQAYVRYDMDPAAPFDATRCKVSAWRVGQAGEDELLWRAEGWHDFRSWVSDDGRHLVRLGPWPRGAGPEADDLAVAFVDRGRLVRQWSTRDLVRDDSRVPRSVSHYRFLHPELEPGFTRFKAGTAFQLTTVDGLRYTFDVASGRVLETEPLTPGPSNAQSESELGASLLLQEFYVAWSGCDWAAWSACLHERVRLSSCAAPASPGESGMVTLEPGELLARPEPRLESAQVDERWFAKGRLEVCGDTAVAWLEAAAGAGGPPAAWRGAHVLTLVRERGAWRILSITWGGR